MGDGIENASTLALFNRVFVQKPMAGVTSILEIFGVLHMD
jgi:hypothetical protein